MRELSPNEVSRIQVDILLALDAWSKEKNVPYYLGYGTLLGAVRHQGYIPWDDDIDVVMLRKDYETFLRTFNENRTDSFRAVHASLDPDYPYEFAKIQDTRTKLVENTDIKYDIGINIDVFVLDATNPGHAEKAARKNRLPGTILLYKLALSNRTMKEQNRPRHGLRRFLAACAKTVTHWIPVSWCTGKMDVNARSGSGDYVANICEKIFKPSDILEAKWFEKTIPLEFEGHMLNAPADYDQILTAWYGDYMQLPPVEERITHHDYEAWFRS